MASPIKNNDQLLLNRPGGVGADITYRITSEQLTKFTVELIQNGGTDLTLFANDLGDVTISTPAAVGVVTTKCIAGEFLMVPTGSSDQTLKNTDFAAAVNSVVAVDSVFDLNDVDTINGAAKSDNYKGTVLLGQTSGGNKFVPANLDEKIHSKIDQLFSNSIEDSVGGTTFAEYTYHLLDVGAKDSATISYDDGEVLIYRAGDGVFKNESLGGPSGLIVAELNKTDVIGLVNGSAVKPAKVAGGNSVVATKAALGVVAIKADSGLIVDANGLLEVDPANFPDIPEAFRFRNTFYWEDGDASTGAKTYDAAAAGNEVTPASYVPVLVGDVFVGVKRTAATGTTTVLTEWLDANGDPLGNVEDGQLVVCIEDGDTGAGPVVANSRYARMGVLDYNPAAIGLQDVLDASNTATGKNIQLSSASVELTAGSFTTTEGDITSTKGLIKTTEGDVETAKGSVKSTVTLECNGSSDAADVGKPAAGSLSVGHIDFSRFPDLT